ILRNRRREIEHARKNDKQRTTQCEHAAMHPLPCRGCICAFGTSAYVPCAVSWLRTPAKGVSQKYRRLKMRKLIPILALAATVISAPAFAKTSEHIAHRAPAVHSSND